MIPPSVVSELHMYRYQGYPVADPQKESLGGKMNTRSWLLALGGMGDGRDSLWVLLMMGRDIA